MTTLKYTLLSEGPSDKALMPLIHWLFANKKPELAVNGEWCEPTNFPAKPEDLAQKIRFCLALYPCDILFVHRDSDRELPSKRVEEILDAMERGNVTHTPHICVIPVKMLEAWFLFDEVAIRSIAENPKGTTPLSLPKLKQVEAISDPKDSLRTCVELASGRKGRRKENF